VSSLSERGPALEKVYQEYAGQLVEFIGVDIWDRREDALEFIEEYGVTYPNGIDEKGNILIDYGVTGIPETLFIGCDGVLAKKFVGPIEAAKLRATLDHLMSINSACGP
jgi:cytochrome c biogenesis protein CcmG/thiol:disulfide interchange protein DsbE